MIKYTITLNPVYFFSTVEITYSNCLSKNCLILWHRVETLKTISNVNVIFNTVMTEEGKSLSCYPLIMTSENYTLDMYLTNKLTKDLQEQSQGSKEQLTQKIWG